MKSIKNKSIAPSKGKKASRVVFLQHESKIRTPTPKDFDNFLPWLCLNFRVPRLVIIKRLIQEEYRHARRSTAPSKSKSKVIKFFQNSPEEPSSTDSISRSSCTDAKDAITLTTYYNYKGNLVEIAFEKCPYSIHEKIIRAINLCLPFHTSLHKFTVTGGGLTQGVLYEMGKLLPFSKITDICLDGNNVEEGNYFVLLDKESQLQSLSLRRCKINDEVCKGIAEKLNFGALASNSLCTLDLSSNQITDIGAQALGDMLRTNRVLVHLGLADNRISDFGADFIFSRLTSFVLAKDDLYQLRGRYLKYVKRYQEVYKQCEENITKRIKQEEEEDNYKRQVTLAEFSKNEKTSRKLKKQLTLFSEGLAKPTLHERVERETKEMVGEFSDIFDDKNVIYENGKLYAIGNLKLSSLNIAYNNLGYISVKKLYNVLKYQSKSCKPESCKGLLRVIFDGNNIPKTCEELEAIETYLDMAVSDSIALCDSRLSTSTKSSKSLHK